MNIVPVPLGSMYFNHWIMIIKVEDKLMASRMKSFCDAIKLTQVRLFNTAPFIMRENIVWAKVAFVTHRRYSMNKIPKVKVFNLPFQA